MPDEPSGSRSRVPKWDGNPAGRQAYLDEVRLWALSEDLDVKYCVAARLIQGLSGSARRACMKLTEDDLQPRHARPEVRNADGDVITPAVSADLRRGINAVLERLDFTLGDQKSVRRGTTMNDFSENVLTTVATESASPTG